MVELATPVREDVTVKFLSNSYIPAKSGDVAGVGEVSVQFTFNRLSATPTTTANFPEFLIGYVYNLEISEVDALSSAELVNRLEYDSTGIGDGNFHYYINYGSYNNVPIRWFIWAKAGGEDGNTATALASDDIVGTEKGSITAKSNTYYFISENILNVSKNNLGVEVMSEYYDRDTTPFDLNGSSISDYSMTNTRSFLNGKNVRIGNSREWIDESNYLGYYYSTGETVNMFEMYNLTSDSLFGLISAREIETNVSDKFWCLTEAELTGAFTTQKSLYCETLIQMEPDEYGYIDVSYLLRDEGLSGYEFKQCYCDDIWGGSVGNPHYNQAGVRPAFQLTF